MRTRFLCSVGNEAVLKALFKFRDDDLTFRKAVEVALEMEDAAKVAKETVRRSRMTATLTPVFRLQKKKTESAQKGTKKSSHPFPEGMCSQCGKTGHSVMDCQFINSKYQFCQKKEHIKGICPHKKKNGTKLVGYIIKEEQFPIVNSIPGHDPAKQHLQLNRSSFIFEVNTGAKDRSERSLGNRHYSRSGYAMFQLQGADYQFWELSRPRLPWILARLCLTLRRSHVSNL